MQDYYNTQIRNTTNYPMYNLTHNVDQRNHIYYYAAVCCILQQTAA